MLTRKKRKRATISTALNELGYPKVWVDSQLSHADLNRISATYNHAEYIEQRRVMMQDWADRLDLFEQHQVQLQFLEALLHPPPFLHSVFLGVGGDLGMLLHIALEHARTDQKHAVGHGMYQGFCIVDDQLS